MFGFLIKGEVNDDAVRLKTLTDQVFSSYMALDREKLNEAISRDFPGDLHHADNFSVNFIFPTFGDFLFMLNIGSGKNSFDRFLSVQGRGKYAGFILSASRDTWTCSVKDGFQFRATGGAKKLAQLMEKKFSVMDMTNLMK
jgi:hypothetical protein